MPGRYLIPALEAVLAIAALAAVRPAQAEVIPDQLRLRGGEEGAGKGGGAALVRGGEKLGLRPPVGKFVVSEQRAAGDGVPARVEGEVHRGGGRDRAEGGLAARVAGIKENGHGVAPFFAAEGGGTHRTSCGTFRKGDSLSEREPPLRDPKRTQGAVASCPPNCGGQITVQQPYVSVSARHSRAFCRFRSGLRLCPLSRCCGGVSVGCAGIIPPC